MLILALAGLPGPGNSPHGQERAVLVPEPITADDLLMIEEIPSGKVGAYASPEFYAIVGHGLTVVPELGELLSDPAPTAVPVPLVGGVYTIGDIAMSLISSIIRDVPWLGFITEPDDPDIEAIGFGVYWRYVRSAPEHRLAVREKFLSWFASHDHLLVWEPQADLPAGGWYRLVEQDER